MADQFDFGFMDASNAMQASKKKRKASKKKKRSSKKHLSAGQRAWINKVKSYSHSHSVSYKKALKALKGKGPKKSKKSKKRSSRK
jgi:hypothetical protein